MEIEAKFSVPKKDTFEALMSAQSIGPFALSTAVQARLEDTYLDTVDMAIMSSGHYLRRRQKEDSIIYTIKSLGGMRKNGVRHREEMEYLLKQDTPFEKWNDPDMKEFLAGIVGKNKLIPLFNVSHIRNVRNIFNKEKHVAELSLDDVLITVWEKRLEYLEIEVEMLPEGNKGDMEKLMDELKKNYSLSPDSLAKFEYALQLMQEVEKEGPFLKENMDLVSKPLSVQKLFEIHHVERVHARKVTENALKLFDELKEVHGLEEEYRRVIWIAALVHDVGVYTNMADHHKTGRDILMHSPPRELPHRFWPVAVWTTFLHKKKMSREKLEKLQLKPFGKMSAQMQENTLRLAALIRIADGLDYSRMHSQLNRITIEEKKILITVQGPGAQTDAARADEKSDLWRILYEHEITFKAAEQNP
ncbi:hypothetical protein Metho_0787 [Methanomethylovorans hollandica DSM 15978]|uniref:CYTH domain-containing protein n=1 Tax=Methanomethylovorans hollandica (strain DSM 15978 / NBRC 107637 / DMS1) TaxID=867904 RepID=L0KWF6_METHD|nr:CYTH domain-containing protein [Methanomethylovorans hollandica]AGB49035.1 hypothetical protein Metho_0787 [Methanomethylovorans hollandica DSM 15978]